MIKTTRIRTDAMAAVKRENGIGKMQLSVLSAQLFFTLGRMLFAEHQELLV